MRFNLKFTYLTFVLWVILFAGCTNDSKKNEEVNAQTTTTEEEWRQLFDTGMQLLKPWERHWSSQFSSFQPSQFVLDKTEVLEELEWPEENFIIEGNPFFSYLVPHPEGEGIVDIYSYKVTIPAEGKPGFNPDSEVIYFKSNGMRQRLLFMGPSGGFEEAAWISSDLLMVAGWFEDEAGVTPMIWMIEPKENRYKTFIHPFHTKQYPKEAYLRNKLTSIDL
jgi:hypothetical protein